MAAAPYGKGGEALAMRPFLPAVLIGVAAPLVAADPELLGLVGPDANFVLGVRVAAIAESPLILDALSGAKAKDGEDGFSAMFDALGDNPLEGLEELLFLGRMEPGESDTTDGLLLARGDFAGDRLQKAFCTGGCKQEVFSGMTLFHGEHEGEAASFVKLNDRYAAAGKPAQVKTLLQRRGAAAKPQLADELSQWVKGLDQHHIWLAAKGPFEAPDSADGGPPFGKMAESLMGFGLGISIGDDVLVGLQVEAESAEAAEELHMMTQGLLMMLSASGEGGAKDKSAALLENLKLRREGGRVFADLRIPAAEIQSAVRSSFLEADDEEAARPAPAPQPKPRSKGPIRIYGLGDEPVVVGGEQ